MKIKRRLPFWISASFPIHAASVRKLEDLRFKRLDGHEFLRSACGITILDQHGLATCRAVGHSTSSVDRFDHTQRPPIEDEDEYDYRWETPPSSVLRQRSTGVTNPAICFVLLVKDRSALSGIQKNIPVDAEFRLEHFNGGIGILMVSAGVPISVVTFSVIGGQIAGIYIVGNPQKLQHLRMLVGRSSRSSDLI